MNYDWHGHYTPMFGRRRWWLIRWWQARRVRRLRRKHPWLMALIDSKAVRASDQVVSDFERDLFG